MTAREDIANSWQHAIDLLYDGSWKADLGRYRSDFVYRGLSDSTYDLQTSLIRLGGDFWRFERHLLRNFRKYSQLSEADQHFSDWKWLTIGQHHGLPTRLLDWTYSPFVALHFATNNIEHFDRDGVIWCVDYTKAHERIPKELEEQKQLSGSLVFTVGMLERVRRNVHEFDHLSSEPFAVFFEPPSMDDRIVNQFALFSVLSTPQLTFSGWLASHPQFYRRVVLPKHIKWEIRDKLDQANITERVLFPGLDGLATWLKRHYSPKS